MFKRNHLSDCIQAHIYMAYGGLDNRNRKLKLFNTALLFWVNNQAKE